jgi:hypothetical protein
VYHDIGAVETALELLISKLEIVTYDRTGLPPLVGEATNQTLANEPVRASDRDDHRERIEPVIITCRPAGATSS